MANFQKFDFLRFFLINCVTIREQDLNGINQISLGPIMREMRESQIRYRQVSQEGLFFYHVHLTSGYFQLSHTVTQFRESDLSKHKSKKDHS